MDTVPLLPRLHDMRSPVLESITTLLGLALAESRLSMNGLGAGEGVTGDGDGDNVVPTTFPTEKSMATTCDKCQGTHSGKLVRHTDNDTWISGSDVDSFCCYGLENLLDSW
jgi:hypothetical protein